MTEVEQHDSSPEFSEHHFSFSNEEARLFETDQIEQRIRAEEELKCDGRPALFS